MNTKEDILKNILKNVDSQKVLVWFGWTFFVWTKNTVTLYVPQGELKL